MTLTQEELDKIEIKVNQYRKRLIEETHAINQYRFDVGREPCCAKHALTGNCLCWQDSWC